MARIAGLVALLAVALATPAHANQQIICRRDRHIVTSDFDITYPEFYRCPA